MQENQGKPEIAELTTLADMGAEWLELELDWEEELLDFFLEPMLKNPNQNLYIQHFILFCLLLKRIGQSKKLIPDYPFKQKQDPILRNRKNKEDYAG